MSLPSDRSFCCAMLMFSTLWQDAICHSNELLCGEKKEPGEHFSRCQGSRECKVCNTVNSSGPALQGRGLPVYQFFTGTIHAKLKQGIENLGLSPEHFVRKLEFPLFGNAEKQH